MQEKKRRRGFRVRGTRALVFACLGVAVAPGAAWADPAGDLIQEGVALRRKGDDEGALNRFQRAYELDTSPRARGQMGLAEQALGRWVPAHQDLSQALEATSDAWIAKNAATLRGALVAVDEHVGKLEILGGSPGAEVSVDGVSHGKLPLPTALILPTGVVSIRLSGTGLVSVQRSTQIRPHQVARESFDALPAAAPPAEPAAVPVLAAPAQQGRQKLGRTFSSRSQRGV